MKALVHRLVLLKTRKDGAQDALRRGVVRWPEGTPADQVRVDLYNVATDTIVASRRTSGFGFVDLSPGEYRLGIDASPKTGTASAVITVVAGQATPVSLILSR